MPASGMTAERCFSIYLGRLAVGDDLVSAYPGTRNRPHHNCRYCISPRHQVGGVKIEIDVMRLDNCFTTYAHSDTSRDLDTSFISLLYAPSVAPASPRVDFHIQLQFVQAFYLRSLISLPISTEWEQSCSPGQPSELFKGHSL